MANRAMYNYIMVGNPGVGKSSTINSFVGRVLFRAAPSFTGSGITGCLDIKQCGDIMFLDTPGLNDNKKRKEAALAIEEALKEPGEYRLIFVIREEEGRLRPDDLTTIKLVMDALNEKEEQIKDDMYSILVNKVEPEWLEALREAGQEQAWVESITDSLRVRGSPVTKHVHLGEFIKELRAKTDALVALPEDTRAFLNEGPTICINGCGTIDADSFEEQQQKAAEAEEMAQEAKRLAEQAMAEKDEEQQKRLLEEEKRKRAEIDMHAAIEKAAVEERRAANLEAARQEEERKREDAEREKVAAQKARDDAKASLQHEEQMRIAAEKDAQDKIDEAEKRIKEKEEEAKRIAELAEAAARDAAIRAKQVEERLAQEAREAAIQAKQVEERLAQEARDAAIRAKQVEERAAAEAAERKRQEAQREAPRTKTWIGAWVKDNYRECSPSDEEAWLRADPVNRCIHETGRGPFSSTWQYFERVDTSRPMIFKKGDGYRWIHHKPAFTYAFL